MEIDPTYMLQVGNPAKDRLELQHEVFRSGTAAFLDRAGIEPGKKVLVVGCGCGFETEMIAAMIGKETTVIAVDNSKEQLEIAQNRAQVHGISNICYIEASVYTLIAPF